MNERIAEVVLVSKFASFLQEDVQILFVEEGIDFSPASDAYVEVAYSIHASEQPVACFRCVAVVDISILS